jgi:hypothetical protein
MFPPVLLNAKIIHRDNALKVVEFILTPALAALLLTTSPGNRKRNLRTLKGLKLAIESGEFVQGNDNLLFDVMGCYRNGHHRAEAVMQANKSIAVTARWDVSEEALRYVDTGGAQRTASDVLRMRGYKHSKEITSWANASRCIIRGTWIRFTAAEILEYVEEQKKHIDWAQEYLGPSSCFHFGFIAGPLVLAHILYPKVVDRLVSRIVYGADMKKYDPALMIMAYASNPGRRVDNLKSHIRILRCVILERDEQKGKRLLRCSPAELECFRASVPKTSVLWKNTLDVSINEDKLYEFAR